MEPQRRHNQRSSLKIAPTPLKIRFSSSTLEATSQWIRLFNKATDSIQVVIYPPETNYFSIKLSSREATIPGGSFLDLMITFQSYEVRHYFDSLRFAIRHSVTIDYPIHAEPDLADILPPQIFIQNVPLGSTKRKTFTLKSINDCEGSYFYICSPGPSSDFQVTPRKGVISRHSPTPIEVSYTASTLGPAEISLNILFPALCPTAFHTVVTANLIFTPETDASAISSQVGDQLDDPSLEACTAQRRWVTVPVLSALPNRLLRRDFKEEVQDILRAHRFSPSIDKKVDKDTAWFQNHNKLHENFSRTASLRPRITRHVKAAGGADLGERCTSDVVWFTRFELLKKLMQAGFRSVIQNRLLKNLDTLQVDNLPGQCKEHGSALRVLNTATSAPGARA